MTSLELLQNISKYLSRFSEQVEILNSNGEFSINTHAENLMVDLLNIVYDLNLKNVNVQTNYFPAIDLLDRENKISFQVTATRDIDKVKLSIEKFFRNGVYKYATDLNIYIITGKQNKYSSEAIQVKIDEEYNLLISEEKIKDKSELPFQLDISKNILDKKDLYKKLYSENNLEKIKKVEKILSNQFSKIEEKENLSSYFEKIKNFFYDIVMDDENGLTLDQIFVDPSFSIYASSFKRDDLRIKNKTKNFLHVDDRYKLLEFINDIFSNNNFLELSQTYRLILLLGYPGQGKSSFCKKFLNDYILTNKVQDQNVFYFSLRNIRQIRDFIFNPLNTLYEEACLYTDQHLDRLNFYKATLVLDGLDELYMRENLKLEEIDRLCKDLSVLIEQNSDLNIIVTSRYGYVDLEKLYREKICIIQLAPLRLSEQTEWLNKYSAYHPETWLTNAKLKIFNTESKYKHIKELIEQPLLLHMVASIREEIDASTNRAKIYSQLFTELIERKYSKDGQLEIFQKVRQEDLRELIREIAFAIFQTGNEFITKYELLKLNAVERFSQLFPEENLRASIKGIMISFYFKEVEKTTDSDINDKSNYAIEFLHKSLREYLTAEKIYTTLKSEFLDKRINGKYIVDDPKTSAEIIFNLFTKQDLTPEILTHLNGIITNDEEIIKKELVERLLNHLDDFVANDFLLEYKYNDGDFPIKAGLRCLYSYWYTVSILGLSRNYFKKEKTQRRFCELLSMLGNNYEMSLTELDFSYQDFEKYEIQGANFSYCNFYKTKLPTLFKCSFYECNFEETEYPYFIESVHLNKCYLKNLKFKDCLYANIRISHSNIESISFERIKLYQFKILDSANREKSKLKSLNSNSTSMDKESYEILAKYYPKLKKCKVELFSDEDNVAPIIVTKVVEDVLPHNYKRIIEDKPR
ncbi:MAG TPA: SMEK domain-containing protein [Panacibacter sp.]|nr:SMEK domain-containing protein [Panacibacter sp.]